jgi:hypothetical protein
MIDTSNIKQMVSHILRRQRGVPDREAIDPGREWGLGVLATVILVVIGGLVSYGLYLNTISLEVDANQMPAVAIPYNAAVVDQAVLTFRARAEAFDRIRGVRDGVLPVSVPAATTTETTPDTSDDVAPADETSISNEAAEVTASSSPATEEAINQEDERPDLGV